MPPAKLCRHRMPTGRTCKSPAMRGSAYCYYHGPQAAPRRARKTPQPIEAELELVPFDDPSCIDLNGQRILFALASNRISVGRASVMLQCLHASLATLRESREYARQLAEAGGSFEDEASENAPLEDGLMWMAQELAGKLAR